MVPTDKGVTEGSGFWSGKSVLVTGAQGFIGSWLVERLIDSGASVVVTVRDLPALSRLTMAGLVDRCTHVWSELQEVGGLVRAITEYEIDFCFHLAAQTIVDTARRSPHSTFESNIRGTYNVLEAFRAVGGMRGVVVASSDKAYGASDQLPYSEALSLRPRFPYDTSKACADLIARSYAETYEMPVAITRLANVYGGGDFHFTRIVPDTVKSLLKGERPVIRSDGSPEREFLYIDDAISAYMILGEAVAGERCAGEAFNFGGGNPVRIMDLVEMIIDISGSDMKPDVRGRGIPDGEIDRQFLDSSKAQSELGWTPEWDLRDGLVATYSWYEENLKKNHLGL